MKYRGQPLSQPSTLQPQWGRDRKDSLLAQRQRYAKRLRDGMILDNTGIVENRVIIDDDESLYGDPASRRNTRRRPGPEDWKGYHEENRSDHGMSIADPKVVVVCKEELEMELQDSDDVTTIADRLGITVRTVKNLMEEYRIPPLKVPGKKTRRPSEPVNPQPPPSPQLPQPPQPQPQP